MTKYVIKEDPAAAVLALPLFFLKGWILMLVLGGLGHELPVSFLFKFDYWNTLLLILATVVFRNSFPSKWIAKEEK